jgi:hypothetical protein
LLHWRKGEKRRKKRKEKKRQEEKEEKAVFFLKKNQTRVCMNAKLLPITLKCASLSAVSNPGASAETSQRYRPLVDASTFVSTTLVEVDESV